MCILSVYYKTPGNILSITLYIRGAHTRRPSAAARRVTTIHRGAARQRVSKSRRACGAARHPNFFPRRVTRQSEKGSAYAARRVKSEKIRVKNA